jgi:hypothetical protein
MIVPATSQDEKLTLVAYLASKIGTAPQALVGQMPFEVVTVTRSGLPVGAVLYINYRVQTIEMACAGEPGWLTPGTLRDIFAYPYHQLGVWSVVSLVARRNKTARIFNKKLGFRELGVVANGPSSEDDSLIYSMTRPECRWLGVPKAAPSIPRHTEGVHAHGAL